MRSAFAVFLRGFVLPFGVTSGTRIVFDGTTGKIEFYNSSNDRVGLLMPDPSGTVDMTVFVESPSGASVEMFATPNDAEILFHPPDFPTHTFGRGRIIGDVDTARELPFLLLASPKIDSLTDARLFIQGEAGDGTRPTFLFDSGGANDAEMLLDGKILGEGLIGIVRKTASDAARAAGVDTYMTNTVALKEGHWYGAKLHSNYATAAAGGTGISLERDGTKIGLFKYELAATSLVCDSEILFLAAADDASTTLTVINDAGSAGNLTLNASATEPGTFAITDYGAP